MIYAFEAELAVFLSEYRIDRFHNVVGNIAAAKCRESHPQSYNIG